MNDKNDLIKSRRNTESGQYGPSEKKEHEWLYENEIIHKAIMSLKSPYTQRNYSVALSLFFRWSKIHPDNFFDLEDFEIRNLVTDYYAHLEKTERTSWGMATTNAIKKILRRMGRELKIRKEDIIEHYPKRSRADRKTIPNKEQIYNMKDLTPVIRNQALILCLFQSGLRIGTLVQLKYAAISDYLYDENGEELKKPITPIPIKASRIKEKEDIKTLKDAKCSKKIVVYYTYLGEESAIALQNLIRYRKTKEGWQPQADSLIFTSLGYLGSKAREMSYYWSRPTSPAKISALIKELAKRAGIPKNTWTHLIRASFQNFVDSQTGDPVFSQLLMGHTLGQGVSASSYGDYSDTPLKRETYKKINWMKGTDQRLWELTQQSKRHEATIDDQKQQINELEQELKIRNNIRQDEIKQLREELDEAKESMFSDERMRTMIDKALEEKAEIKSTERLPIKTKKK